MDRLTEGFIAKRLRRQIEDGYAAPELHEGYLQYIKLSAYEDTGLEPHEVEELKKKATPIRPEYEADGYDDKGELDYDTAYCPVCRRMYEVGYEDGHKYCDNCGQALDWSDKNA